MDIGRKEERKFKWHNCNFLFNTKGGVEEKQTAQVTEKTKSTVAGVKPTLSIIMLNVNRINIPIKNEDCKTG